jgi:hypothetical protein
VYKNGYVLSVISNGDVLEEDSSRQVTIPFGIEYKVRLINKTSQKAAADLRINGEDIARFILNAWETSDIERFLDGSNDHGKRFKFVSLNDGMVKDKKDFENGLIEVRFHKEIIKPSPVIIKEEHHHHHYDWYPKPELPKPYPWPSPIWKNTEINCDIDSQVRFASGGGIQNCCNQANTFTCDSIATGVSGATVRGSESNQKFETVSGFEFDSVAVIMKLKLINGELKSQARYCSGCGRRKREGDKYCPQCGGKL